MITDQEFVELKLAVDNSMAVEYLTWLNCKYYKELSSCIYSIIKTESFIDLITKLGMRVNITK